MRPKLAPPKPRLFVLAAEAQGTTSSREPRELRVNAHHSMRHPWEYEHMRSVALAALIACVGCTKAQYGGLVLSSFGVGLLVAEDAREVPEYDGPPNDSGLPDFSRLDHNSAFSVLLIAGASPPSWAASSSRRFPMP